MMLSSPSSFYTALDSLSSSSPAPSMADGIHGYGDSLEHPQYCQANQISNEIEEHVKIYFDELLCMFCVFWLATHEAITYFLGR